MTHGLLKREMLRQNMAEKTKQLFSVTGIAAVLTESACAKLYI